MPEPVRAPRWDVEALRRLLRPGYGSRANARDATWELLPARRLAWGQCAQRLGWQDDQVRGAGRPLRRTTAGTGAR
jgi:hypothetical protein